MVSAIIHLANRDYTSLVDDFIALEILPSDCDRAKVEPLMDKALTPYVKGGGAQRYEEELKKMYGMDGSFKGTTGGFQAMTQDALTVLNDIPFSIPAYFALLGRAIVTLEGIALTGDPNYGIIMEAYPFVARKLLREDRPEVQKALQAVLYSGELGKGGGMSSTRLLVLLQSALGSTSRSSAFIDIDTFNGELSIESTLQLLLSEKGKSLRSLLTSEAETILDILFRQNTRKTFNSVAARLPRPPLIGSFLPRPETVPFPFLVPKHSTASTASATSSPLTPVMCTPIQLLDTACPKLTREEELYCLALVDTTSSVLGSDARAFISGEVVQDPRAVGRFLLGFAQSGSLGQLLQGLGVDGSVLAGLDGLVVAAAQAGGVRVPPSKEAISSSTGLDKQHHSLSSQDLGAAVTALAPKEKEVLTSWLREVSGSLQKRVVNRLQVLL